ncbi:hypothetical protein [Streptomyces sp. JW3]|uniref:hypothetical protein n=1 Tax=Streptomyces sp. JW3 TaxID=3456955 RepID=UPI003FA44F1D
MDLPLLMLGLDTTLVGRDAACRGAVSVFRGVGVQQAAGRVVAGHPRPASPLPPLS